MNLLELVYEYHLLRAKERSERASLDDGERARALGLGRLLSGHVMGRGGTPKMVRLTEPLEVSLAVPGGFTGGRIRSVSNRGLAISTSCRLPVGRRTIVQVVDPESGLEYTFPGRVVWCGKGQGLGIAFDGEPERSDTSPTPPAAVHARVPRFGSSFPTPMLA